MLDFFFPKLNLRFFIRLLAVTVTAVAVFGFILMPCVINGASMEPTYPRLGFNFCNKLKYRFRPVQIGDVVIIRYLGRKYFLKRVVALDNDSVEFRQGQLWVNGKMVDEKYLKDGKCDWNLPLRKVAPGNIYVVGDNRTMPISQHQFGEVSSKRISGAPLW